MTIHTLTIPQKPLTWNILYASPNRFKRAKIAEEYHALTVLCVREQLPPPPPPPTRPVAEPIRQSGEKASTAPPVAQAPKPAPPVEGVKPEVQPAGPKGPAWILEQPASHFTVQLLATASRERWQSYLAARRSENRLAGFQMRRDGTVWYVVLFGSYATRAEADSAARSLPASLGQVEPWVRTFGSIHAIMIR